MIRAVTLDANHTLFEAADPGGEYARVLARHGVAISAADAGAAIAAAWSEFSAAADPARDRFAAHEGGGRGFWRRFVARVCALAGAPPPSPFAAAELYERFAGAAPYRVFADVEPALAALRAHGIRLALVSNWDARLPRLVGELGLAEFFDVVIASELIGREKPRPEIFAAALERLALPPAAVVHVGDRQLEDVEGARAAGLHALRLDRAGGGDLASLAELPGRLASIA